MVKKVVSVDNLLEGARKEANEYIRKSKLIASMLKKIENENVRRKIVKLTSILSKEKEDGFDIPRIIIESYYRTFYYMEESFIIDKNQKDLSEKYFEKSFNTLVSELKKTEYKDIITDVLFEIRNSILKPQYINEFLYRETNIYDECKNLFFSENSSDRIVALMKNKCR